VVEARQRPVSLTRDGALARVVQSAWRASYCRGPLWCGEYALAGAPCREPRPARSGARATNGLGYVRDSMSRMRPWPLSAEPRRLGCPDSLKALCRRAERERRAPCCGRETQASHPTSDQTRCGERLVAGVSLTDPLNGTSPLSLSEDASVPSGSSRALARDDTRSSRSALSCSCSPREPLRLGTGEPDFLARGREPQRDHNLGNGLRFPCACDFLALS
jgi:hypothetical protein